jgi:4-hydroxy-tetrahydrodipicolinate synthase
VDRNSVDWHGTIPALVTPFGPDGSIDEAGFRRIIEMQIADGVHGVMIGGCTGEFWALSMAERGRIVDLCVETVRGRVTVIAGTGAISTADTIALTAHAKTAGADGALILPPYFVRPDDDDIVAHYRAVSDAVAMPLMLYNIPSSAVNALTPALCDRLADIENVVAIKESSGDFNNFHRTLVTVQDRLRVFCGPSSVFGVPASLMGAVGHIDCFPNVWCRPMVEMYHAVTEGRLDRARELQRQGMALTDLFVANGRNLYCATKAAMTMLGLPGGVPRLPLRPLSAAQEADLRAGLVRLGFDPVAPARAAAR